MRARQTNTPRRWNRLLAAVLKPRLAPLLVSCFAPLLMLSACGGGAGELVELRLYPCMFGPMEDMPPASVVLTIDSFDADGAPVDQGLTETFTIDDPSGQFGDGYATVGYKKPAEVVSADFRVVWQAGMDAPEGADMQALEFAGLAVPDPGGSIELMSEGKCPGGGGTTTEPMTGSGTTTGDMTTTTDMTLDTTTTGGETTTGSTGVETTGDPTTGGTTTTGEPEDPVLDQPCTPGEWFDGLDFCWTEGYGEVGTIFECNGDVWIDDVDGFCSCGIDMPGTVNAGCSGNGPLGMPNPFDCLCRELAPSPIFCGMDFDACDGDMLTICDDDNFVHRAICPQGCMQDPNDNTKGICGPNPMPIGP